jgi:hypothetical protein
MKLLSIGNSFSVDAQRWLHTLAKQNGIDLQTGNLYIGGCSLQRHWENIEANAADYVYYVNGETEGCPMSIAEALALDTWDVVTLQQASHVSGEPQSYIPYLTNIAAVVRAAQPQAKLCFHQTWAYETDSIHPDFENYNHSQSEMYNKIIDASEKAADEIDAQIIPTGTIIQRLRKTVKEFDYKNGGLSFNRDGFHLTLDYGRYTATLTWCCKILGEDAFDVQFVPQMCDENVANVIKDAVNTVLKGE